ncbi:MAG: tetratricopeptide repeat protein [Myxococcales bacterium]|nr:tetratricopeptide repeat protein [Myxococcales bacterium]
MYEYQVFGTQTPFVGRRVEMETLYNAMRQAALEQKAHIVNIHGQAGIGKDRLTDEFIRLVDSGKRRVKVYRARFPERELGTPFAAFTQILRQRFRIEHQDTDAQARDKLIADLARIVDGARLNDATHLLGTLLQLPFATKALDAERIDTRQFLRRAYRTCFNLLRTEASRGILIIVFDRWGSASDAARQLVADMMTSLAQSPVVAVILSHERAVLPPMGDLFVPSVTIQLRPLEDRHIRRILEGFLEPGTEITPELLDLCITRSAGVPRDLENVLRLLVQRSAIRPGESRWTVDLDRLRARPVPENMTGIARERVFSLGAPERQYLEAAAILGCHYWHRGVVSMLRALSDEVIDPVDGGDPILEGADRSRNLALELEMVQPVLGATLQGENELGFVSNHERDELLHGLRSAERPILHRLAAQWMKHAKPHEPAAWRIAIADQLAHGQKTEEAARHLLAAAEFAQEVFNNSRAIELYRRALSLLGPDNAEDRLVALSGLAWLLLLAGDYSGAASLYQQCCALGKVIESPKHVVAGLAHLGKIQRSEGRYIEARRHFDRALALAEANEEIAAIAGLKEDLGKLIWHVGAKNAYQEAMEFFLQSMALYHEQGDEKNVARCLTDVANIQLLQGRTQDAEACHRQALELRRNMGDRRGEAMTLIGLGATLHDRGELHEARNLWTDALRLATEVGDRTLYAQTLSNLGESGRLLGDYDTADRLLREAEEVAHELKNRRILGYSLRNHADLLAVMGQFARAEDLCEEAIRIAEETGNNHLFAICLRTRTEIMCRKAVAAQTGSTLPMPTTYDFRRAEEDLDEAFRLIDEIGDKLALHKTLDAKSKLLALTNRPDEAAILQQEAHQVREQLGFRAEAPIVAVALPQEDDR